MRKQLLAFQRAVLELELGMVFCNSRIRGQITCTIQITCTLLPSFSVEIIKRVLVSLINKIFCYRIKCLRFNNYLHQKYQLRHLC